MVAVTCPTPKSQVAGLGVLLSHCEGWRRPPAMQIGLGDTLLFDLEQRTQDEKVSSGDAAPWSLCVGPCAGLPQARVYSPGGANTSWRMGCIYVLVFFNMG